MKFAFFQEAFFKEAHRCRSAGEDRPTCVQIHPSTYQELIADIASLGCITRDFSSLETKTFGETKAFGVPLRSNPGVSPGELLFSDIAVCPGSRLPLLGLGATACKVCGKGYWRNPDCIYAGTPDHYSDADLAGLPPETAERLAAEL